MLGVGPLGHREEPLDIGGFADVLGKRDAAEAGALGGNAGVFRQQPPRKQRDREGAGLEKTISPWLAVDAFQPSPVS